MTYEITVQKTESFLRIEIPSYIRLGIDMDLAQVIDRIDLIKRFNRR